MVFYVYLTAVSLLALNWSAASTLAQSNSSSSFVLIQQQIPTSGITTLKTIAARSTVQCGGLCSQLSSQTCKGFMYHRTTCSESNGGSSNKSGTCQLLSFSSLTSVSFVRSTSTCRRFSVRSSLQCTGLDPGCDGQVLSPSLTYIINGSDPVSAVAYMNDKLFVSRWLVGSDSSVYVYDANTFELLNRIRLPGSSGGLQGLTVDSKNNILYVADKNNNAIFKANVSTLAGSNITATKWSVGVGPAGVSVKSNSNLLLTYYNGMKIEEYTPNGSLVRALTDTNSVYQAVEVNNETLAFTRYNPVHGVGLMSVNGTVKYSYGSSTTGSGPGQMFRPRCLAVDKKGYIAVDDANNNRILVFYPTLSKARALPLPIRLIYPMGIWLDESRGRLYVGEYMGKFRVLIFDNVFHLCAVFCSG